MLYYNMLCANSCVYSRDHLIREGLRKAAPGVVTCEPFMTLQGKVCSLISVLVAYELNKWHWQSISE